MSVEPPAGKNPEQELQELWQSQELKGGRMSVEQIRVKAGSFEKKVRLRNGIEYSAAVIVLSSFGYQTFTAENIFMRVGAFLTVLATLFVVYVLHTRGSAQNLPEELGRSASLDFHRSSLVRQRNLLQGIWRWYLLPFVPGVAFTFFGFAVRDGLILNQASPASEQGAGSLGILVVLVLFIAVFLFAARLNKRYARKLQAEIDALDK
jgi:hypothetical protein